MTSSTRARPLLRLCVLAALGALLLFPAGAAPATVSGKVVAWGCGSFANAGQCSVPGSLTGVTAVSAGAFHSLALLSDGTVAAWGCIFDNVGQCSVPNGLSNVVAVAAGGYHSLALKSNGTVVAWGCGFDWGQCDVPSDLSGVTAIAAGSAHSLALKSDGTVVAWGCQGTSDDGQCDVPSDLSGATAIAAGGGHSLAVKSDGTVVAWGCGGGYSWGQCSVPNGLSGVVAVAASSISSLALKSDGTVVGWGCGAGDAGQCAPPAGLTGVTAIAAGDSHSLARKSDGTVVAWGCGNTDYGQCSVPSGLSGAIAIAAAFGHSLAVRAPAPKISGFSPAAAPVDTIVTIGGANLDGATSVSFGGVATAPTFVSPTQVRAVVPADARTGHLDVTTPVGIAHSVGTFRVLPRITSITPGSGPADTGVTIDGSGLADLNMVKFAGVPARVLIFNGVITAFVPPTALSGRITVTTAGGTAASPTVFLVLPAITTFAPSHAAPGSPVDVLGTGLGGVSSVKVNGIKAGFSVLSRTQLRLRVPASATDGPITITTAGGTATSAATLFVIPRVGSVTPGAAPVGTTVTIGGNAFSGSTSVLFNGVAAVPATVTATKITVVVPADASTGKLTVVTPSGSGESAGTFRVLPRITSFGPASGPVGTSVTITGSGFTDVQTVKFNGVAATAPSIDSDHQITAQVPATATSGRITVTTAGGTVASATRFVVTH
jgi:IPT/TIG domain/Regulator of chromosome condensation (RCC1) repeat